MKLKTCFVIFCLSILTTTFDRAHASTLNFDSDPALEQNWMIDGEKQVLIDRKIVLTNINNQKRLLESKIKADPKFISEDSVIFASKLLSIYRKLNLLPESKALVVRLENNNFAKSKFVLQEYYQLVDEKLDLIRVLERSLEMHKSDDVQIHRCAQLVRIGDLYYEVGRLEPAEAKYKEAYDFALKTEQPAGTKEHPGNVKIGAMYNYACFLAKTNRLNEAVALIAKIQTIYWNDSAYALCTGYGGIDNLGTFLLLVKEKDPHLYQEQYKQWEAGNRAIYSGLIGKSGEEITPPTFAGISKFDDGCAIAQDKLTCLYGYVDRKGNWLLKPQYTRANPFSHGLASVKISKGLFPLDTTGGLSYFSLIDKNGKIVKNLLDRQVDPFDGKVCLGRRHEHEFQTGVHDLIDANGDILLTGCFEIASKNNNIYDLSVVTGSRQVGCTVTPIQFNLVLELKPDESKTGHFNLTQINRQTKLPNPKFREYLQEPPVPPLQRSIGQLGLVDAKGHAITPAKYSEIRPFSDGLAAVQANGLWGFIDESGKEVIALKYTEVGDFQDGVTFYKRK